MKKLILSLLMFLGLTSCCFASISVDSFVTGDDVTIDHLEDFRETVVDAINSADGGLLQDETVTSAKLDDNANPENRWNEGFNDFVYNGLVVPTSASLAATTTAGTGYIDGVRVVKDATAHTYTASKHTWVDLSSNGTYTYNEVAINAAEPSTTANSIRLYRVSTDATTVASVVDHRVTTITLAAGSALLINDTDSDTYVHAEENSDEDIVRVYTGGTERATFDSNGFILKENNVYLQQTDNAGTGEVDLLKANASDQAEVGVVILSDKGIVIAEATSADVSTSANQMGLFSKNDGTQTELYAREESDGDEVQITKGGMVNKSLGAWVDKSASYAAQVATTDGFVLAWGDQGSITDLDGYTDSASDPTTLVQSQSVSALHAGANIMFPVKKGDYWKIVIGGTGIHVYWIPLGD